MAEYPNVQFHSTHSVKHSRLIIAYHDLNEMSKSEVIAYAVIKMFEGMPPDQQKLYSDHYEKMRTTGKLTKSEANTQGASRAMAFVNYKKVKGRKKVKR